MRSPLLTLSESMVKPNVFSLMGALLLVIPAIQAVPAIGRDLTGLGVESVSIDVDGHSGFLLKPNAHWPGEKATPWVLYAPALPAYPGKEEHWMLRRLLLAGIAVAGIDVGESQGNPDGRRIYSAFYDQLTNDHGLTVKACLLARSRGGLMLYNWAAENPDKVAAVAGIYPVCDLRTYPGLEIAANAYGMDIAEFEQSLSLHNPVDRLAPLAKARVPLLHIHGDKDKLVPYAENAIAVRDRYRALGGSMQLVTAEGQWHNMWEGFFQCEELIAFLLEHCRAQAEAASSPVSRIAFGACARLAEPQQIWNTIAQIEPDIFVFTGDNVYADTSDPKVFAEKYGLLAGKPGFKELRKRIPMLATWDDHDYGVNDGGVEFEGKAVAKTAFLDFFAPPLDAPIRDRAGVYSARMFGPAKQRVQVIMLDTRSFRDSLTKRTEEERTGGYGPYKGTDDLNLTMLGKAQWDWLEQELKKPAQLRVIASSVQVVSGEHGWECWNNFPHERARLYRLIGETRAKGVVFISGDRHLAELSCDPEIEGKPYPMYDFTSSGLNQAEGGRFDEPNRYRASAVIRQQNFGEIVVDWEAPDPTVEFRVWITRNRNKGDTADKFLKLTHRIQLSEISVGQ
ncbi:MAG: alkaline phosphatase D [Verrucomicrobiales bacterium]|jgi:alkaline phosphatase D